MKKQGSDQAFHDRRHQERKRAEAERKVPVKKKVGKAGGESRAAGVEGDDGAKAGIIPESTTRR